MSNKNPTAKRLSDYQVPDFFIDTIDLEFELEPNKTLVKAVSTLRRNGDHSRGLVLDGAELTLKQVEIDGEVVTTYLQDDQSLTLSEVPDQFTLSITTLVDPANNTSLEGLYQSAGAFCTQCEAEGFRKITYFLDRPDVLATYRVKITADKSQYPYLLANGNCVDKGELDDGRHWVCWEDPFKKPCYLFALVAGDFDRLEDSFTTQSGRNVALELYVDKGNLQRGHHAIESLKNSMRWDEETYGLEYDLDIYMIVAVDFFNMGAMENKGLNVFNSRFVLADPASATDEDFFNIESVIGHEYFHNWTGNRVTCRDWFQLSLKEGLTVFRDQQFSADMSASVRNRISDVKMIRDHQFTEDAGPMSHPIRPEEVIEMNNFYTATVYNKGAEVIRMMHTILGVKGFRAGMDLYFERHDGQAVTCDDFVQAMEDANDADLGLFRRWYSQSGTPEVTVTDEYDAEQQEYRLTLTQHTPATADQKHKQALHIPVETELLAPSGESLALDENGAKFSVLNFTQAQQTFVFNNIEAAPVPVMFRGFSAPVKVLHAVPLSQQGFVLLHSQDPFSRWEASQSLYSGIVLNAVDNGGELRPEDTELLVSTFTKLFAQETIDPALLAELLTVNSFESIAQLRQPIDVDGILAAREALVALIAEEFNDTLLRIYKGIDTPSYAFEQSQVADRALANRCLSYLSYNSDNETLLRERFASADNMTNQIGVIYACVSGNHGLFDEFTEAFERRWGDDSLVLDKWFSAHAGAKRDDILSRLELLTAHRQFDASNPNRVRAVVGSFAFYNVAGLHNRDGSGYRYLADWVIKLNDVNPQVAARMITPMLRWRLYDEERQKLMQHQLMRIADTPKLSSDLYEKVSKSLGI